MKGPVYLMLCLLVFLCGFLFIRRLYRRMPGNHQAFLIIKIAVTLLVSTIYVFSVIKIGQSLELTFKDIFTIV